MRDHPLRTGLGHLGIPELRAPLFHRQSQPLAVSHMSNESTYVTRKVKYSTPRPSLSSWSWATTSDENFPSSRRLWR